MSPGGPGGRGNAWLLLLFAGSGCSALIYEVVWLQLLQLSIGSSAVSLSVLLGTFMGGMCLGSLALPRFVSPRHHPLRVYALAELGTGACGVAVLFGMTYADGLYTAGLGHGLPAILARGAVCGLFLLPPTVLMGASLPAVARWLETTPQGIVWLGCFYSVNIAGAAFGCLLAGFYLLRVYDMATATFAAAAINTAVAAVAWVLARRIPHRPAAAAPEWGTRPKGNWPIYAAIALSGLCALGAEVVWTRLLSLMLGATVYTFSIILAVFLVGLMIGSGGGSYLARRLSRRGVALGFCQVLLAAAVVWAAWALAKSLPYWRPPSSLNPWARFRFDVVRCLWATLPAACLWGASFPLALAAAARRGQDPAWLAGRVYAANTAGAIAGAIAFSLVLIPEAGTQHSQQLLAALSAGAALLVLAPFARSLRGAAALLAAVAAVAALAWSVPAVPWGVIAYGRQLAKKTSLGTLLYAGEGMNASIAITQFSNVRLFHVSGKVEASGQDQDMRMQRMLGHLPALFHPRPRSVLVVGCGAGVTAGSFVLHPTVERIVICEIEPLIPPAVARYFSRENYNVLRDRRTQVVYEDARHYIHTTPENFDIVTSDPIHPWVKGSATLYTREYFEMCKRRLNPGGIVAQWVPLYESDLETVKSELATFFEVFPDGTIWGNDTPFAEGYDVVVVGQAGPMRIDVDGLDRRLESGGHAAVKRSLQEVAMGSADNLLATYAGRATDLRIWLRGAQINRDRNLRLQYLAGAGLNWSGAEFIYEEMLQYRRYPRELFAASEKHELALRKALH